MEGQRLGIKGWVESPRCREKPRHRRLAEEGLWTDLVKPRVVGILFDSPWTEPLATKRLLRLPEVIESMESAAADAKKLGTISPFDHYLIEAPPEAGIAAKTIGELRAMKCPESDEDLTAISTYSKELSTYVRVRCMNHRCEEHGCKTLFALEKGKAFWVE